MNRKVRVRFAPSPTGPLHIGGVRTALYNYLFARRNGGDMILRIEDTDSNRFVPGAEDYINESLAWLGIKIDEGVREGGAYGPYKQSERRDIYRTHVRQLLDAGRAYIAFDTPEELEAARAATPNFQYDASTRMNMRNSLAMQPEEVKRLMDEGTPYVVRFLIEPGRDVEVNDLLRGKVTINSSILDDKVLYKSADDLPTYHLANIVDDHLMEVSHVIRGEEWLPSAPLHVLLYEAFGWADTRPEFVHLPFCSNPTAKASSRSATATASASPCSLSNGPTPRQALSPRATASRATFPKLSSTSSPFSDGIPATIPKSCRWTSLSRNSHSTTARVRALNSLSTKDAGSTTNISRPHPTTNSPACSAPSPEAHGVNAADFSDDYIARVVSLVKGRINFVADLWDQAKFFFVAPSTYAEKDIKKRWKEDTPPSSQSLSRCSARSPTSARRAQNPSSSTGWLPRAIISEM